MITYQVEIADPNAHLFGVTLTVPTPAVEQRLALPVWIPGSYLVREFARHLSAMTASQRDEPVSLRQLDKTTWVARCKPGLPLVVRYRVYAFDSSVRAAFLDANRAFINGTSLLLRVDGQANVEHQVQLRSVPTDWQVATSMRTAGDDRHACTYSAADYDELVDHPFELGRFWRGTFDACGVPHEFIVAGALPDFDGDRLLADTKRICDTEIAFWHGTEKPPFERYVFMLNAVEEGRGGLEHRASTALIASRRDLPRMAAGGAVATPSDGYLDVLGLISHEYFHTWNVKRLKPRDFVPLDYSRENYTTLLWFFEGFTSYYDDLFLVRGALIDETRYIDLIGKTVSAVLASPGRLVQSVAGSSFDAWVKYYRGDENTPNSTISYYAKGSLVALALDLTLRLQGKGTLDDVMRHLWQASEGGPVDEGDIAAALEAVGGRSYRQELDDWVHGTADLPLEALLKGVGIDWRATPATLAQRLGVRVSESALTGVKVSHVMRGGAGEQGGLTAGDELVAVNGWRVRRLEDALRTWPGTGVATMLVVRDQRVVNLSVTSPDDAQPAFGSVTLKAAREPSPAALALRKAWLAG